MRRSAPRVLARHGLWRQRRSGNTIDVHPPHAPAYSPAVSSDAGDAEDADSGYEAAGHRRGRSGTPRLRTEGPGHQDSVQEQETLLAGLKVVDLAGEPAAMTCRILADLGADVIRVEPKGGDPLRRVVPLDDEGNSLRFGVWNAGEKILEVDGPEDARLQNLLSAADAVVDTPGWPGSAARRPGDGAASGLGIGHTVRNRRPAIALEGVGSRRDGVDGEHVLHGRSGPRLCVARSRQLGRTSVLKLRWRL